MRLLSLIALSAVSLSAQLAPPNSMGVSMGHVHLIVNDPDAQKKLFVDLLGAKTKTLAPLELIKVPGLLVVLQNPSSKSVLYELKQSYLVAGAAGDGMVRRPFTIGGRPFTSYQVSVI